MLPLTAGRRQRQAAERHLHVERRRRRRRRVRQLRFPRRQDEPAAAETKRHGFCTPDGVHGGPCHVHHTHAHTIGPDGSLYACPGFTGEKGECPPATSTAGGTPSAKARSNSSSGSIPWDECQDCAFIPTCAGGCLVASHSQLGDMNKPTCHKRSFESALIALAHDVASASLGDYNEDYCYQEGDQRETERVLSSRSSTTACSTRGSLHEFAAEAVSACRGRMESCGASCDCFCSLAGCGGLRKLRACKTTSSGGHASRSALVMPPLPPRRPDCRQLAQILSSEGLARIGRTVGPNHGLRKGGASADDGLSMTIRLRPNAKFHDGSPVTGEALTSVVEQRRCPSSMGPAFEDIDAHRGQYEDDRIEIRFRSRVAILDGSARSFPFATRRIRASAPARFGSPMQTSPTNFAPTITTTWAARRWTASSSQITPARAAWADLLRDRHRHVVRGQRRSAGFADRRKDDFGVYIHPAVSVRDRLQPPLTQTSIAGQSAER